MQRVVIARYVDTERESPTLAAMDTVDDIDITDALRERIRARIPEDKRDTPFAKILIDGLLHDANFSGL
jgi:hypothetical protein